MARGSAKGLAGKGKVWLAGAGPGDAQLLTIKTRDLIETVDVIVYDALVSTEILSLIPGTCRLIYVGKRAGRHLIPQAEINQILLQEAQAGNQVMRLKGGDPFIFGRGGEELELLISHGIPYEVVPGITSATAVPAYAGIPVTHRNYTSSFHVITGHARADGSCRINYPALVSLDATLIFLMGVTAAEEICRELMNAGMDKDTPAAILEKGTTSVQRSLISTVERLAQEVKREAFEAPSIIVVGDVCNLGRQFCWAEQRVLGGQQILVMRGSDAQLAKTLRELGAQVIELAPHADDLVKVRVSELYESRMIDTTVFADASEVHAFAGTLRLPDNRQVQAVCMDEQTAAAAREYQMKAQISAIAGIDGLIDTIIASSGNCL